MISASESNLLGREFANSSFCWASSFCKFEAYFYFVLCHLLELLFGRVLASFCKAQSCLCVKISFWPNFLNSSKKKAVLGGTYWKFLTKKSRFFACARPSKLLYFGTDVQLNVQSAKNEYLKIVQRGPFGSAGDRIPERGERHPPPKSGTWKLLTEHIGIQKLFERTQFDDSNNWTAICNYGKFIWSEITWDIKNFPTSIYCFMNPGRKIKLQLFETEGHLFSV